MGSNSRGLIAIIASVAFFIIWYSFVVPKYWPESIRKNEVVQEKVIEKEAAAVPEETKVKTIETAPVGENVAEVKTVLQNEYFSAEFSNYGGAPTNWMLKQYTVTGKDGELPVNLVPDKKLKEMPLEIYIKGEEFASERRYRVTESDAEHIHYVANSGDISIEKIYTLGKKNYDIDLKVIVKNLKKETLQKSLSIGWSAIISEEKKSGFLSFLKPQANIRVPVYYMDGGVKRESSPAKIGESKEKTGRLYWAGIEERYFLSAIVVRGASENLSVQLSSFGTNGDRGFYSGIALPDTALAGQASTEYSFTVYGGPKEMKALQEIGMNLDKAIDYGWFSFIAVPILYVLKFLYGICHNYGVAIIVLTILIKLLLQPISKKSMKSMKEMQKLQPRLKELKEKYANNKERLNAEMMQLFKTHKVNPMSGCLPMVLQFPVYIALYRVLWNSIELYHAPFFWFYRDLSQPDPYFITPLLLGVFMFLQQKLTPSATADPAQQKMMMMMPLMFTVFLVFLPVGLVVYILVNTVMTVVQQWMSNRDIRFRDLIRGRIPKHA